MQFSKKTKKASLPSRRDVPDKLALVDPAEGLSLHCGLKARQVSMITLGGLLGTGLIIGSGTALVRGGPLGAYLPHKKGFAGYATRYVDPAFVFFVQTTNNVNAVGAVVQYWTLAVPIEVWMVVYITFIFSINMMGIRVFGVFEFWFCSIKAIALVGLIMIGLIIDLGGSPQHDRIGQVHNKQLSQFLGFWSTLTTALFSYIGTELSGVIVGQTQNPRKDVPKAIRRMSFRIVVFYIEGTFVISLTVPSTNNVTVSPFVIATTLAGIRIIDHAINALVLIFVLSASNSNLYIESRTLYGLAMERQEPRIFVKVHRWLNTLVSFGWFSNLIASFGAITWICAYHAFMRALKAQGIDRNMLPYKAPLRPFGS
ncbi:Amino acid permease domain containing protein [Tylopilus felleus]